ncbi:response regulator [Cohnella cellulosilytica]|uniref:Response regulator n=1 Tax=Cohnella cellulosilytica TaxID=986710 RepID=A0ABW2F3U0_9BACL
MIRCVVVEDEPPILRAIVQMIESCDPRFQVVDTAFDGEEAMEVLKKTRPDVVFTDIRMPIMDGLQLLRETKSLPCKPLTVVLSGHQEFEYAKEALKLGVHDFLLKPISRDSLVELLDGLADICLQGARERQLTLLKEWVDSGTPNVPSREAKSLFAPYREAAYLLVCVGSFQSFPTSLTLSFREYWKRHPIERLLPEEPRGERWIVDGRNDNEKVLIVSANAGDGPAESMLETAAGKLYEELTRYDWPVTLVKGSRAVDISDLGFYLQKARIVLNHSSRFGHSTITANDFEEHSPAHLAPNNQMEGIFQKLNRQSPEYFKHELSKLIDAANAQRLPQIRLEHALRQFIQTIVQMLDADAKGQLVHTDLVIRELVSTSPSYRSLHAGMCLLIDEICSSGLLKSDVRESQEEWAERIEQYIQANYHNPISLQSLSDTFGFAPSYLSRIYREHKGQSPIDYVIKLRMNKAKELLLLEPALPLKQISEAIGYEDSFYFSRLFKAQTGSSPSEFRKRKSP